MESTSSNNLRFTFKEIQKFKPVVLQLAANFRKLVNSKVAEWTTDISEESEVNFLSAVVGKVYRIAVDIDNGEVGRFLTGIKFHG